MDFDLTYLNEVSGGDRNFIDDILGLFVEHSLPDLNEMKQYIAAGNWSKASAMAHKIKSSVTMLGNHEAIRLIGIIEEKAKMGNPDGVVEQAAAEIEPIILGMIANIKIFIAKK